MLKAFLKSAKGEEITLLDMLDYPYELIEAPDIDSGTSIRKWESSYYRSLSKLNKSEPKVASMVDHDGSELSPADLPGPLLDHYVVTVSPVNCYAARSIALFVDDFIRCSWFLGNCPGVVTHLLRELPGFKDKHVNVVSMDFDEENDVTSLEVQLECHVTKLSYTMTFYIERLFRYRLWRIQCELDVSFTLIPKNAGQYGVVLEEYASSLTEVAASRLSKVMRNASTVDNTADSTQSVP